MSGDLLRVYDTLRHWTTEVLSGDTLENYDHIHIDKLGIHERDEWVQGGLLCLEVATRISIEIIPGSKSILMFPLSSSPVKKGMNLDDLEGLKRELEDTPPSVYLLSSKLYKELTESAIPVDIVGLTNLQGIQAWFLECEINDEAEDEPEFRRSLWVHM